MGILAVGTIGEQIKTRLEVAAEKAGTSDISDAKEVRGVQDALPGCSVGSAESSWPKRWQRLLDVSSLRPSNSLVGVSLRQRRQQACELLVRMCGRGARLLAAHVALRCAVCWQVVLPSGVRYTDLRIGGGQRPIKGYLVVVDYE